ncbi:hypothetical protein DQ353_09125 [Arthrobacter sp. AQ5-05]|nr:hypothetical protein DQ353_09125 [Arthrobacter sp. AQ5-05]
MATTRQRMTPARLQGRAADATILVLNVPQLASIAAGALLVAVVDNRWLMLVAGVVVAACALAMLRRGHTTVPGAEMQDSTAAAGPEEQQRPR